MHALLAEIAAVDNWTRNNIASVAVQLSPLVGLDTPTLEVALQRASYGVQAIDAPTLAYQQQIADTFSDLRLIPKKLVVSETRWQAG